MKRKPTKTARIIEKAVAYHLDRIGTCGTCGRGATSGVCVGCQELVDSCDCRRKLGWKKALERIAKKQRFALAKQQRAADEAFAKAEKHIEDVDQLGASEGIGDALGRRMREWALVRREYRARLRAGRLNRPPEGK